MLCRAARKPAGRRGPGFQVTGTSDWAFFDREFAGLRHDCFDACLSSQGPTSGDTGQTWFDDAGVIEWGAWQPFSGPARNCRAE